MVSLLMRIIILLILIELSCNMNSLCHWFFTARFISLYSALTNQPLSLLIDSSNQNWTTAIIFPIQNFIGNRLLRCAHSSAWCTRSHGVSATPVILQLLPLSHFFSVAVSFFHFTIFSFIFFKNFLTLRSPLLPVLLLFIFPLVIMYMRLVQQNAIEAHRRWT